MTDDFVLLTRYQSPSMKQPTVHVYGPWSRARARREQRAAQRDAAELGYGEHLQTHVCKILTPDEEPGVLS